MTIPAHIHVVQGMTLVEKATGRRVAVQCNCGGNNSQYAQRTINQNRHLYYTLEQQAEAEALAASIHAKAPPEEDQS